MNQGTREIRARVASLAHVSRPSGRISFHASNPYADDKRRPSPRLAPGASVMDLISTLAGSMMENYFPKGWDLAKIDRLAAAAPAKLSERQPWWNPNFEPVACASFEDFDTFMGHEIALEIQRARQAGHPVAFILPVGPMGMYRWAVYFLKEWNVACDHVHGFNMDEWSDAAGNTLPGDSPGGFQHAMQDAFYGPLGSLTVPVKQRHFAL